MLVCRKMFATLQVKKLLYKWNSVATCLSGLASHQIRKASVAANIKPTHSLNNYREKFISPCFYSPLDGESSAFSSACAFCIFIVAHCGEQTDVRGYTLVCEDDEAKMCLGVSVPLKSSSGWSCRSLRCPVRIQTWLGS